MAAPIKYLGRIFHSIESHIHRKMNFSRIFVKTFRASTLFPMRNKRICGISIKHYDGQYYDNDQRCGYCPALLCATVLAAQSIHNEDQKTNLKGKGLDDNDELIQTIKRAKLAEIRQNFNETEDLYHRAIAILTMYGQNKTWTEDRLLQARVYVYDSMANLALSRLEFQKAEGLFKETMRGLLQQGYLKTDNSVLDISLKLAMIYAMLNRLEEADKGYQYCIKALEDKINFGKDGENTDSDTIALMGLCVDSYARFLMIQSKYPESLIYMKKALDLAIRVFGETHPQVAVIHNDISTVLSHMEEYDSAREHSAKAIVIAQKTKSPDLPAFLCNMGAIYMYKMDFVIAEKTCKKALKLSEQYNNNTTKSQAEKCLKEIKEKMKSPV